MIRQLVNCKDTKICHVNSDDNTPTYEALTAYQAGCVVQYAGVPYMAIVDIADDDADTPDAAPSKWAIVADANSIAAEAELKNLDTRVTVLEGAIEDINDTLENQYLLTQKITSVQITADGTKTTKQCLDDLGAALLAAAEALDDDQFIEPIVLFCGGYAWMGVVGLNYLSNATTGFNVPFARSLISGGALYQYVASFTDGDFEPNAFTRVKIESTPSVTISDIRSDVPTADTPFEVQYKVWTKISS